MIATDLDGTLLDDRGRLSERNRKALIAARERGFRVLAMTARAPRGVSRVPELAASIDAAICNNGATHCDFAAGTIELRHPIPKATAQVLLERLRAALPRAAFAIETGEAVIAQSRDYRTHVLDNDPWIFVDSDEALLEAADGIAELMVLDVATGAERMVRAVADIEMPEVVMWHWGSFPMIDYNVAGMNKGAALAEWCAERDIGPESVIAFGDMPNDVSMLAWAGRSYAVAGAHPEAVAAATDRTGANSDDGVAQAIEAILEEFEPLT